MSSESGNSSADTIEGDDVTPLRALVRWMSIHDELVRGVAHAMSNRVATLSANVWLMSQGGQRGTDVIATLQSEIERLEELLIQLRILPNGDAALEPLLAIDSARTAVSLHAHYGALRNRPCAIDDPGSIPPARAEPQALVHALLVAITAAREAAGREGRAVLRLRSEGDFVQFVATVDGEKVVDGGSQRFALDALAAEQLLVGSGGRARSHAHGCTVEVPTLASSRMATG
jgi:nitrogen-specific signal transduction histidine kinase